MTAEELVVPPEAAGERLDHFLARHVGSRAAAARAVEAGVLVDESTRPKSYRLAGRGEPSASRRDRASAGDGRTSGRCREDRGRLQGRVPAGDRQAGGPRRPSRGGERGRHARRRTARRSCGGRSRAPGNRPSPRQGHLGADGGRSDGGGAPPAREPRAEACSGAHATSRSWQDGRAPAPGGSRRRSAATATSRRASR